MELLIIAKTMLEIIAEQTWRRLRDAARYGVQFGEETVTNLALLDLQRNRAHRMVFVQTPKAIEKVSGTDFEWWIGSKGRWIRMAVQAKKLDVPKGKYTQLRHKVRTTLQIDLLKTYAKRNRALPVYALYNFTKLSNYSSVWHCGQAVDCHQLGVTLAHISVMNQAVKKRSPSTFDAIHKHSSVIPWRCIMCCPQLGDIGVGSKELQATVGVCDRPSSFLEAADEDEVVYHELPPILAESLDGSVISNLPSDYYDPDCGYPSRIVVSSSVSCS